jgi:hypothetical protein
VSPSSALTCHWISGSGWPLASAVKDAASPSTTVWASGSSVTTGATFTVSSAGLLVPAPPAFVNTAW